ncbi:MAG: hypothetical protein QXY76_03225 [Nitrososphaeria archaeon]
MEKFYLKGISELKVIKEGEYLLAWAKGNEAVEFLVKRNDSDGEVGMTIVTKLPASYISFPILERLVSIFGPGAIGADVGGIVIDSRGVKHLYMEYIIKGVSLERAQQVLDLLAQKLDLVYPTEE